MLNDDCRPMFCSGGYWQFVTCNAKRCALDYVLWITLTIPTLKMILSLWIRLRHRALYPSLPVSDRYLPPSSLGGSGQRKPALNLSGGGCRVLSAVGERWAAAAAGCWPLAHGCFTVGTARNTGWMNQVELQTRRRLSLRASADLPVVSSLQWAGNNVIQHWHTLLVFSYAWETASGD